MNTQNKESIQFQQQTKRETTISTTVTSLCGTVFNSTMFYYYENSNIIIRPLSQQNQSNENMNEEEHRFFVKKCEQIEPFDCHLFLWQKGDIENPNRNIIRISLDKWDMINWSIGFQPEMISNVVLDTDNEYVKMVVQGNDSQFRLVRISMIDSRKEPEIYDIDFNMIKCILDENQKHVCELEIAYSNSLKPPFGLNTKISTNQLSKMFINRQNIITLSWENGLINRFYFDHQTNQINMLMSGFTKDQFVCSKILEAQNAFVMILNHDFKGSLLSFVETIPTGEIVNYNYVEYRTNCINAFPLRNVTETQWFYAIQFDSLKAKIISE